MKDTRGEAAHGRAGEQPGLILIGIVGLSFLLRRSAQVANRAFVLLEVNRIKSQDDLSIRFDDVAGINDAKQSWRRSSPFRNSRKLSFVWVPVFQKACCWWADRETGTSWPGAIAGEAGAVFRSPRPSSSSCLSGSEPAVS